MQEVAGVDHGLVVTYVSETLVSEVGMKRPIGSRLFEPCGGGVDSLTCGGKGAGGQHFDLLGMVNLGTCFDHFLSHVL